MYLGPFYFDIKEVALIILTFFVGLALFFGWELFGMDKKIILTVLILILITKGLLPAIHNEAFFILAIVTILLSLYLPIFQIILFYFISFLLFRVLKVI